jgi:hypothetical protein
LFSRAANFFEIGEQKQLKLTVFVQPHNENFGIGEQKQLRPRSEKLWNWRTKATQINCICSAGQ